MTLAVAAAAVLKTKVAESVGTAWLSVAGTVFVACLRRFLLLPPPPARCAARPRCG